MDTPSVRRYGPPRTDGPGTPHLENPGNPSDVTKHTPAPRRREGRDTSRRDGSRTGGLGVYVVCPDVSTRGRAPIGVRLETQGRTGNWD